MVTGEFEGDVPVPHEYNSPFHVLEDPRNKMSPVVAVCSSGTLSRSETPYGRSTISTN